MSSKKSVSRVPSKEMLYQFFKDRRLVKLADHLAKRREFNVFDVMKNSEFEIRHSNILAWLLNPRESHGRGDMFLMGFMREAQLSPQLALRLQEAGDAEAGREEEYIDIVIRSIKARTVIIIENKVWSDEAKDQLASYRDRIEHKRDYEGYEKHYVFLTPKGEKPSDPNWLSVNYQQIHLLLDRLLSNSEGMEPRVRDFLLQYHYILETRVLGDFKVKEYAHTLLTGQKDAIELLCSLQKESVDEYRRILQGLPMSRAIAVIHLVNTRSNLLEELFGYLENEIMAESSIDKEGRWTSKKNAGISFQTTGLTGLNRVLMARARQEDYLLAYEAGKVEDNIDITLYVLPGKSGVRQLLIELTKVCLRSGEGPLNACARVFTSHKIHHVKLLDRDDLIRLNLSQAKDKLKTEFNLFVQTEAPKLERYVSDKLRKA